MTQLVPDPPGFETEQIPRSRYRVCRFAFALGAVALGCQSAQIVLHLYASFSGDPRIEQLIGQQVWQFWIGPPITFGAALSSYLLIGRFPDETWNRRAIMLAAMNTFDIGLWLSDHSQELNLLHPVLLWVQHPLAREGVQVLQWFELGLFMALASDLIRHLGRESAIDLQRTGRATAVFGFLAWLVGYIMLYARASGLVRARGRGHWRFIRQYYMLNLLTRLLLAMTAFQATVLCALASRDCAQLLSELDAGQREREYGGGFADDTAKGKQRDPWG
jgi:hypothetical protein